VTYSLLSFDVGSKVRAGLAVNGLVFDLAQVTQHAGYEHLAHVFEDWLTAERLCEDVAGRVLSGKIPAAAMPLDDVRLLAPYVPGNIFCAGANFQDHIEEMARAMRQPVALNAKQIGENPWHFIKTSRSAIVGPGAKVVLPTFSDRIDYEIELAVVIGRAAKNVSVDRALDHVAGYTIANDLSAREVGRPLTPAGSPFHYDWITMKCFDGSCPLGPWIVPASSIADPQAMAMKLWVNGESRQDSTTAHMIFSVAEQIAWLSSRVTLQPGDVILTGTPAGVGMPYQRFLKSGDVVRLWIEHIGEMSHEMVHG
jgi:2-keto-4-pentenoate hydratase/2-oxohepta-3-ene-1,7-dioic acid hydratase in catechol pathway